jgi:O-antigen/teichoic acid export membrane protein
MTSIVSALRLLPKAGRALVLGLSEARLVLCINKGLLKRGFFRNVLVVMSGTGLAQVLSFLFSPVLSRLYGPVDFGCYGSFLSVSAALGAVVTLQYSEALMLPGSDDDAAKLFAASCLSAVFITAAFTALCALSPGFWLGLMKTPELKGWLLLIPLAALVAGLNQTLTSWCARRKAFKRTAGVLVVRSIAAGCGQTAAGIARCGGGGLIGANLAADILATITLGRWVLLGDHGLLRKALRSSEIKSTAREYKDFPLYSTPQNFFNAVSLGAPVILLIHYYGMAIGGIYAFSVRVLQVPTSLVLTSLRQVLFQKLSEVHNSGGDLARFFTKCTGTLFAVAILPAIIGCIFAPHVFAFVFGSKWFTAGEYARWLIVWFLPGVCNLPAALLGRILRRQRALLLFDLSLLICRITALVLGGMCLSAIDTIAVFSVVGAMFNTFLMLYVWNILKVQKCSNNPPSELL